MKCTSIAALQVECGEMPLKLRRESLQNKYGIKIKTTVDHPTANILKQNIKISKKKTSFAKETQKFLNKIPPTAGPVVGKTPPWHHKTIQPIFELHNQINKNSSPTVVRQTVLALFAQYNGFVKIYTDGSKNAEGVVGAAFFIATLGIQRSFRLSDNISIYTAEMIAIQQALLFILHHKIKQAIIVTDSLSVLQSIQSGFSHTRPNLLEELKCIITEISEQDGNLIFIWVPAHCGIIGNEAADKLAKGALSNKQIDKIVPFELKEAYALVDEGIGATWQREWTNNKKGRALFEIEPRATNKIKYSNIAREKETCITRMRLGKCYLNSYLHKINVHATGLCLHCNKPETIDHYLFDCLNNAELTNRLQRQCQALRLPMIKGNILFNTQLSDTLYNFIRSQERRI